MTDYYRKTGLDTALDKLGFQLVGYGCTTCIGNSGPLPPPVAEAVKEGNLVAAAVLSGNRNFEGRVNPLVKANYLASPPLVVAYALAGSVDIDLATEPLGTGSDGRAVYLKDIWPSREEVKQVVAGAIGADMFRKRYENVFQSNPTWNALPVTSSELYPWDENSTYVQEPPFLLDLAPEPGPIQPLRGRGCWRPLETRSRRTISRPPAISRRRVRPGSIFWSTACSRPISTATAPAAATTA